MNELRRQLNTPAAIVVAGWALAATLIAVAFAYAEDNRVSGYEVANFTTYIPAAAGVTDVGDVVYMGFVTLANSGAPALAADGATDEDILFWALLPESYDSSEDLDITLIWASAGTSESVEWEVSVGSLVGEDLNTTAVSSIVDTLIEFTATSNGTSGISTYTTVSVANGLIDAATAGSQLVVLVNRDASADSGNSDSYLIGLEFSQ